MALVASPPPLLSSSGVDETMSETIDEDIARVRAQIHKLTQRRKLVTSSLLASTEIQARLSKVYKAPIPPVAGDITQLLEGSGRLDQANVHRIGLGVTAFPFNDPSPELQLKNPLLGVRIDICSHTGAYDSPYYLFFIRVGDQSQAHGNELRLHRHTIPALVPLQEYERLYLPVTDEGYGGSEDSVVGNGDGSRKQDLYAFVARVRHDLVSWRLRQGSIDLLKEGLEIPAPSSVHKETDEVAHGDDDDDEDASMPDAPEMVGKFGVCEVSATGVDACQARIVWSDDRVGRIKITEDGVIEKARVIGLDGNRILEDERTLTEKGATVYDFIKRLERLHNKTKDRGERPQDRPRR